MDYKKVSQQIGDVVQDNVLKLAKTLILQKIFILKVIIWKC